MVGFTRAVLVYKHERSRHLNWLLRRFQQMHDLLRESPIYQLVHDDGRLEERHEFAQQIIEDIVTQKFPALAT